MRESACAVLSSLGWWESMAWNGRGLLQLLGWAGSVSHEPRQEEPRACAMCCAVLCCSEAVLCCLGQLEPFCMRASPRVSVSVSCRSALCFIPYLTLPTLVCCSAAAAPSRKQAACTAAAALSINALDCLCSVAFVVCARAVLCSSRLIQFCPLLVHGLWAAAVGRELLHELRDCRASTWDIRTNCTVLPLCRPLANNARR